RFSRIDRTSSTSGFPSKQSENRDSTSTEIRNLGNSSFSALSGLVSSRQSPIERRRMIRMRAFSGRPRSKSLVFNLGFADQHHWDIVAYRIDPVTLAAFQPLPVMNNLNGSLAKRTNEDFEEIRIYRHKGEMLARESLSPISPLEPRRKSLC